MDIDRQTNLHEERMSDCRSFSSNYRCCSQSRKISVGVMVDSFPKAETKDMKEAVMQIAENGTSSKGHSAKDREGHSSRVEKHVQVSQKDTTPWVSTRSFNPKTSSSVAERTPSFPATSNLCPRSKLSEKASAAHSVKFFAGKTVLESDEGRQKNFGKAAYSMEAGNVNNVDLEENLVFPNEPGVLLDKELVEDKDRQTEMGGRETLRMKLWEILENVSSPNKHCPGSQPVESHRDKERDGKHHATEKSNPSPDTIESDSERSNHNCKRPVTRSLSRKKANTKNQHINIEAKRSTCRKTACPLKRIFSFRGDVSDRFYDNDNDGSFPSKRKKFEKDSSRVQTCQRKKYKNVEERQQSENKSRSIPGVDKLMLHRNKVDHANSSNGRMSDAYVEPKSSSKKNNSFLSPLNVMTEQQKDVPQSRDVEIPKLNDRQEDVTKCLLKKKRNFAHDPLPSPTFGINSPGCLPRSNLGKPHDQSPGEILDIKGIRSFNSFLSSKSAECKPNAQVKSSDGRGELNGCHPKPSFIMEENNENRISKSSTDETNSESSEDDSHVKGGRESEPLSPEICIRKKILHGSNISLTNNKGTKVTGSSPMSESLKGIADSSELQMCSEQNQEDGLASAVALFTVALARVKTKLKSMTSKRSAEILRAAAEETFLQLQNAESQIKIDVGKLNNHSQSKRKRLETIFQEQHEQLLGIYKKFKEAVNEHLQDYGSVAEDLEEHEIELKRTVERRRAAHKMFLSQVEQEIKVQLDDAESRIMAVQELAREKMLQLKLVVAECIKHGAFG